MQSLHSIQNALERFERAMPTATAIVVALMAWLFLQLDPLGMEQASNAASRRVAMRLMSAFYPVGSDQVSVVLIDDDYLRSTDGSWPMTYFTQGYILRRVLDYQPRSVFVDILYRHAHASMRTSKGATGPDPPTDLVDAVIRTPKAPVIFADLPPALPATLAGECHAAQHATIESSAASASTLDAILAHARQARWNARSAYVGWQGCGDRYPLVIGESQTHRTPAYASFAEACLAQPDATCQAVMQSLQLQLGVPIAVRWGALPSVQHFEGYHEGECQPPAQTASERFQLRMQQTLVLLEQFARSFAQIAEASTDRRLRLPCPSIDTIRAGELMSGHPDRVREFIKDRYVFIGVHLDGVQDQFPSPVNGLVPGATFNAMALDNLLRLQSGYLRQLSQKMTRAAEAVMLIVVLVVVVGFMHQRKGWFDSPVMLACYAIGVLAVCAVTFVLGSAKIAAGLLLLSLLALMLPATRPAALMFMCVAGVGFVLELILVAVANTAPGNWIGMLLAAAAGAELGRRNAGPIARVEGGVR